MDPKDVKIGMMVGICHAKYPERLAKEYYSIGKIVNIPNFTNNPFFYIVGFPNQKTKLLKFEELVF